MGNSGLQTKASFEIENGGWGTPIGISGGNQIHFTSESIRSTQQNVNDDYFNLTNRGYSITDQVFKTVSGNIQLEAYYDDINLIAATLGLSNLDTSPENLGLGAFRHKFYFDDDKADRAQDTRDRAIPDGAKPMHRRGTLGIDKGVHVWQFPSTMINTMTLTADPRNGIDFNLGCISYDIGINQAPNGSSTGWSFFNPSDEDKVLFEDISVYMTDFDDPTPVAPGNLVCLDSFSITFDSHLSIQNDRNTLTFPSQPFGRLGTITGNLNFPFYTSDQETIQLSNLLNAQKVRIVIIFLSDNFISISTEKYGYTIDIKQAFLTTGGADIQGPGVIPTQLNFIADRTETATITTVPNDVEFIITNQVSVNPLEY